MSLSLVLFSTWMCLLINPILPVGAQSYNLLNIYKAVERCPNYSNIKDISDRILILKYFTNKRVADSDELTAFIYFCILLYFFLGISIISNIFMLSIEIICSQTRKVYTTRDEDGVQVREQTYAKVWNDTVANLTLVSLGTSAPEILLSVIETFGNGFCPGALGPGTIVGSASFNLMIITAVCIVSIPGEGIKRIKNYKVFITTSIFAMGAYIWLVIIIQVSSPNLVYLWEAVITLLMFPILVGVSYWSEYDFCIKGKKLKRKSVTSTIHDPSIIPLTEAEAAEPLFHFYDEWDDLLDEQGKLKPDTVKLLYAKLNKIALLTDQEIATIIATKLIQRKGHTVLWYRIRAIQALVAGQRVFPCLNEKLKEVMDVLNDMKRTETGVRGELRPAEIPQEELKKKAIVEFTATCIAIPGSVGHFTVLVRRIGKQDTTVFCKIVSYDGTATKNNSYLPISKEFVFEPYVAEQKILVYIIPEKHTNKDSNFFLKLSLTKENDMAKVALGPMTVMEVVIMDIEQPGEIQFVKKGKVVTNTTKSVEIDVERINGSDGSVKAKWKAVPGPKCTCLIEITEGILEFEHGEMKKIMEIPINPGMGVSGEDEQFDIELTQIVGGGGKLGSNRVITIAISADANFQLKVNRICEMTEDLIALQSTIPDQTYIEQIKSAFIVNGDKEEAKRASTTDVVLHWVSLPWKMIFCFLPPPLRLGGWPCFFFSLAIIGILTATVGDMANIFGQCLSLDPVTTGVTFVAIGTSLPDTFASRIAALQSPTADAAIGNVMGSNSVNVFLGLGLPWTIATIYAHVNYEQPVIISAGTLAFIVTIYTCCAIAAQIILALRRHSLAYGFAELGGPSGAKWLTGIGLILGWLFYVSMAILVSQGNQAVVKLSIILSDILTPESERRYWYY